MDDSPELHLNPDRPIETEKDDLLERAPYAHELARRLAQWHGHESMVVGLFGKWGSGKSSVKNLIIDYLKHAEGKKVNILEFNPWHFSGQEQLFEAFFAEVGKSLALTGETEEASERAAAWRRFAGVLGSGAKITKGLKVVNSIFAIPGAGLILDAAEKGFKESAELAEAGITTAEAGIEELSLSEAREQVRECLMSLDTPLLIVIDDVDRLTSDEICLIFRLIKANADFPNLNYLVLCQREIVASALNQISNNQGDEFLEKIIQLPLDIPSPQPDQIASLVWQRICQIAEEVDYDRALDVRRWERLWSPMSRYITTLREAYRFLNALSFNALSFRSKNAYEVNFIDLAALEFLRVFEPSAYHVFPSIKLPIFNLRLSVIESIREEGKAAFETVFAGISPESSRGSVQQIVIELFPMAQELIHGSAIYDSDEAQWSHERRVCDGDFFDRYFRLAIRQDEISESDIAVLNSALISRDRSKIGSVLGQLEKRGLCSKLLLRLESNPKLFQDDIHVESWLLSLSDIADELPPPYESATNTGVVYAGMEARRRIMAVEDVAERCSLLQALVKNGGGIHLAALVASTYISPGPTGAAEAKWIPKDKKDEIGEVIISRIAEASEDEDEFLKRRGVRGLIFLWKKFDQERAIEWVNKVLANEATAFKLVEGMFRDTSEEDFDPDAQLATFNKIAPLDSWIEVVEARKAKGALSKREEYAIKLFTNVASLLGTPSGTMAMMRDGLVEYLKKKEATKESGSD